MDWFVIFKYCKNGRWYRKEGYMSDIHYSNLCANTDYHIIASTKINGEHR